MIQGWTGKVQFKCFHPFHDPAKNIWIKKKKVLEAEYLDNYKKEQKWSNSDFSFFKQHDSFYKPQTNKF